jgi:hypothetical protein
MVIIVRVGRRQVIAAIHNIIEEMAQRGIMCGIPKRPYVEYIDDFALLMRMVMERMDSMRHPRGEVFPIHCMMTLMKKKNMILQERSEKEKCRFKK